jgi:pyruvate/2-oxoacid:ferredoxin oxidoreductase alpha subunit
LTLARAARQDCGVQMTDAYASAVTVSIPIFVLAAGAEARAVRERLKRPDEEWERDFAAYRAEHELNIAERPFEGAMERAADQLEREAAHDAEQDPDASPADPPLDQPTAGKQPGS